MYTSYRFIRFMRVYIRRMYVCVCARVQVSACVCVRVRA